MRSFLTAVLAVAVLSSVASAQRAVNTGSGVTSHAWEFGIDAASVTGVLEKPKSVAVSIGGQPLIGVAYFFSNAMAVEPRFSWFSQATENAVGFSTYSVDIGMLIGLSSMDPDQKPMYVRPSVMLQGGSGGQRSFTTLSGAFGMRMKMHGVVMKNEIGVSRRLESGPFAARTFIQLRHGISLRKQ